MVLLTPEEMNLWNPPFVDLSRNKFMGSTILLTPAEINLWDPQ